MGDRQLRTEPKTLRRGSAGGCEIRSEKSSNDEVEAEAKSKMSSDVQECEISIKCETYKCGYSDLIGIFEV
jgi:hypothetical protein